MLQGLKIGCVSESEKKHKKSIVMILENAKASSDWRGKSIGVESAFWITSLLNGTTALVFSRFLKIGAFFFSFFLIEVWV